MSMSDQPICCRDAVNFLLQYLDDELPPAQRQSFEQHLKKCPPCVDFLASYQATIRLGKACAEDAAELPEALREGILRALRDAKN